MGASKYSSGYASRDLGRDARRAIDDRLKQINAELPHIKLIIQEKYPDLEVPWADEPLPEGLRKIEEENPCITIPRISELSYSSLADALYFSIVIDEKKRDRYLDFSLEKCQKVMDKVVSGYRENGHIVLASLLLDVNGDLGDDLLRLIEDKFNSEVAATYRGTIKNTFVGDEPLFAFDEIAGEGIADNNGRGAERWRSGDVGKRNPWTRILDLASSFINVNFDDIFEALLSRGEDDLENELELHTAPVGKLFKLTRKMVGKEFRKKGFSTDELIALVHQRQKGYTRLSLQIEDVEASESKVMQKVPFCIGIIIMLFFHRIASKVYAVHKKIDPLLRRFKVLKKLHEKYKFWYWLFDKAVYAISYPMMSVLARLYGVVGLTNSAYYAKEKPGVFQRISRASGDSPILFLAACAYAAALTGKTASDVRTKEEESYSLTDKK